MSRINGPAGYHVVGSRATSALSEADDEQNLQGTSLSMISLLPFPDLLTGGPSVLDNAESIRSQPVSWMGYQTFENRRTDFIDMLIFQ